MSLIAIKQGDADTFSETITGLSTLSGYTCKMYIFKNNAAKTAVASITGTATLLVIAYELTNEKSKAFDIGMYRYETKIFDSSDHVYTPSTGKFIVGYSSQSDPT